MKDDDIKRFTALHFYVGAILLLVCFWDFFGLHVTHLWFYYPYKFFSVGSYFTLGYLVHKKKIDPATGFTLSTVIFYLYAFIGTLYVHPTYIFSFYQGFAFICFVFIGPFHRFFIITTFGLILAAISIQHMPEPEFLMPGHSLRHHLQIVSLIFGIITFFVYWFFNRQREVINEMTQHFASIGRQSSFLLHELKSPLARFIGKNSSGHNKDADYIYGIIEGVEMLVTSPEYFQSGFTTFNWQDIQSYLNDEFEETCQQFNINLSLNGFEGEAFGQKSTLKLAFRNLVKNAIESIDQKSKNGKIQLNKTGNRIEVSNNGSPISQNVMSILFKPFYSSKKSEGNIGIGLHFVESVFKAHQAEISVHQENGWSIFRINFKEV